MTHPEHDPDEAGLRALFDATADELSGPGLTKLRARAADIPARRRSAWWKIWAPALALAMGGLVVLGIRGMNQPSSPNRIAENSAPTELGVTSAPPATATPAPVEEEPEELAFGGEEEEEAIVPETNRDELELDDGSEDLLAFGVPSDDDELDAWLEATDELLGEGG